MDLVGTGLRQAYVTSRGNKNGNKAERHSRGMRHSKCNKDCKKFCTEGDAHRRSTPEQRYHGEERRLAHVAATREKDRLAFVQVRMQYDAKKGSTEPLEPSAFAKLLEALPSDVVRVVVHES